MSADDARDFLESLTAYNEGPVDDVPSQDKPVKLGTVDALYSGSGNPKVLFDGESLMGVRTYPTLGPVRAGDRVVLLPQGHTYVIIGVVGAVFGSDWAPGSLLWGLWSAAPVGFLLLDGTVRLRADYPALFAVIGTTYNTGGETSLQFRMPDFRGHTLAAKAASGTFGTLGAKVGAETVTLTAAQSGLPSHQHAPLGGSGAFLRTGSGPNMANWVGTGSAFAYDTLTAAAGGSAASQSHNNVQPTAVGNLAVKY